jgi:hypothetical protein
VVHGHYVPQQWDLCRPRCGPSAGSLSVPCPI